MESKTVSLIVFYLLPMPSVWSKKISCTKKTLLRSLKKKWTHRHKSSNNRAKKKDSEEYTVLPNRVQKPLMLIYKKLLLRPCKICKITLLLSIVETPSSSALPSPRTAVAEGGRRKGSVETEGRGGAGAE